MKIRELIIRNFRGLEDIEISFRRHTCLIAGPNAIGKSTILEAIRLNRSILLSRYPTEGQSILFALGAAANPNQMMIRGGYFDFSAIARDPSKEILIRLSVQLEEHELAKINKSTQALALDQLRGSLGNQLQNDQIDLTQFLSSESGREKFGDAQNEITEYVSTLNTSDHLPIGLVISPDGQVRGENASAQIVCGYLERSLPPQEGLFSYFSADRALPTGEAAIQLGAADADNQIKSHVAESHLKFQRLKTSIANSTLLQQDVEADFEAIFDEIMPGKRLAGLEIGPIGNFRVSISEEGVDRFFDIDSLSSGEKGLILTFLLIRRTVSKGGIVLIDEPELHLNPGVCRKLLSFFIDHCIQPQGLQAIICTHSAEILNSGYERQDCDIHHLKAADNATPIYRGDFDEMFTALGRLGVSPAESFFYESRVFVEGPDDEELLEEGFRQVLGDRCQISSLGGRKAIEAEVRNLQEAEKSGKLDKIHCFIFDQDKEVTELSSSALVKVVQWDRYCFENYLLNPQVLYDVLVEGMAEDVTPDRGEFQSTLKTLAFEQLKSVVARQVYEPDRPVSPGLTNDDLRDDFSEMADVIRDKLSALQSIVSKIDLDTWRADFINSCNAKFKEASNEWDSEWVLKCDGKTLFSKICRNYSVTRHRRELKKEVIRRLRDQQSTEWQTIEKMLSECLQVASSGNG